MSSADIYRRKLINHFSSPFQQDDKDVSNLRDLCESDFEREVYDILTNYGYRVKPQVKVGQYRIDMIVEGDMDARIAVECDGDQYHGPDRWLDDMNRQRILERAGLTFWRSFASDFVMEREDVIAGLLNTLKDNGISPIGCDNLPRSLHTELREVTIFNDDNFNVSGEDIIKEESMETDSLF